ncbi:MAG: cation transporter [Clostridiaceae bacterium]|nr:cation transporter [Clostridiaceae bacterium]
MTNWLIKLFVKDYKNIKDTQVRVRYGKLAGIVGIISNVFLFAIKLIIGIVFNSIAIVADAINNILDASSSVITMVGFKISGKPADKEHPYGHARAEYITGFIVSIIIMLLGLELTKTSIKKIFKPDPINFSYLTVIILVIAILTKLWQSRFNKDLGKRISSTALIATAQDSMNDVIATSSVLAGTLFAHFTKVQIDGYMGVGVAIFIIYSGYKLVTETLNPLLGLAPDPNLVKSLEKKILSYPQVLGLHDLEVHCYGPNKKYASVHVEVSAKEDFMESHDVIDKIERDVLKELNIHLVIHMDPMVTDDELINELRRKVNDILKNIDDKLSMHDFRLVDGKTHNNLVFDVVLPPSYSDKGEQIREQIQKEIFKINPSYYAVITFDRNYISNYK